jgi:nitrate reductase (NAD(P)H)
MRLKVYDATEFLDEHPGGKSTIILAAGADATEDFMAVPGHLSSKTKKQLAGFHIGTLVSNQEDKTDDIGDDMDASGPFLNTKKWKKVKLVNFQEVSKDSRIYRFALTTPEQDLGLPTGQHVWIRLHRKKLGDPEANESILGELVQRQYTPISEQDEKGFIVLLIKCVLWDGQESSGLTLRSSKNILPN